MKKIASTLLFLFLYISSLQAQELKLFSISNSNDKTVFTSLSNFYPDAENPELKVIPDDKLNFDHSILNAKFRKQFLTVTKIAETDSVFLYEYATNKLAKFVVKNLNAVANLSPYEIGSDTPHNQYDYMIGFEIEKKFLKDFGDFSNEILVYVGKQNPFAQEKMTPITWKKISSKDFPFRKIEDEFGTFNEKYLLGDTYRSDYKSFQYLLQDYTRENRVFARRLFVINSKTKAIIYEEIFSEGESDSLTPLNFINKEDGDRPNQWTGKLFKGKKAVIFGFTYQSFGCPYITILGKKASQVDIYCDNRH